MRTLLISLGNPLRRDDGIAHYVLDRLASLDLQSRSLTQLTPEIAADLACYDLVIFIDADAASADVMIKPVIEAPSAPAFTHATTPSGVVSLARALFGFSGKALICCLPANDFSWDEGLTSEATVRADGAAHQLTQVIEAACER